MENMRKQGYKMAERDIKQMGIEWAKHTFALRLKCIGCDSDFTVGYGEAIVVTSMRECVPPT
jgi:hypothetical protein